MQLWNTLTRRLDDFIAGPVVRLYVCGITPYDTTHLGHARTYLLFDVLIRELERKGHIVRYVQNVTDVDDPLFERAQKLGRTTHEVATEYTRIFQDDMARLGVRPPDFYPRASGEITQMQRMVADLLEGGFAYQRDNRVYYRVRRFHRFGQLSKLERQQMLEVARDRGEDPDDPQKEDPLDFVLWKPSQPGEDSWPSPWGEGRPGWHIECSAMALHYLGAQLDIHGGGDDLVYPHHESEIAQSEAATGHTPFARYWLHVGMVQMDGVKMSKSLGNLVLVRELLPQFNPGAVRHYLLSTHYRSAFNYTEEGLHASAARVRKLEQAIEGPAKAIDASAVRQALGHFESALENDLDTPTALAALNEAVELVLAAPDGIGAESASEIAIMLRSMAERLGLITASADDNENAT